MTNATTEARDMEAKDMETTHMETKDKRHDVCIVGLKCYDLLARNPVPKYLGGVERILVAFARSLVFKGLRVAFVTFDEGQPDVEILDGITVIKAHDAEAGMPLLRLVHPRMTFVWRAMAKANARTYIEMGAGVETFAAAMGARRVPGSRFIYCVASNMDCEAELSGIHVAHEKLLYRRGLQMADQIVCQTQTQAEMLQQHYGRSSAVILMPSEEMKQEALRTQAHKPEGFDLIWVGRTVDVKRIEWYLDIAEQLPEARCHIVGSANQDSDYARTQMARAEALSNVVVHGRISDDDLFALYQGAFALCCTSLIEGFPTTFLEAWKLGVPVVTTFDPDGVVAESGAGAAATTVAECVQALKALRDDDTGYKSASLAGLQLYRARFSPEAIMNQYLELLNDDRA